MAEVSRLWLLAKLWSGLSSNKNCKPVSNCSCVT